MGNGIYGENKLSQIINDKNMKQWVEAHTSMYLLLVVIFFRHDSVKIGLTR